MVLERLLYKPAEAARLLSIGRTKLYEALRSGDLPSIKLGTSRLIDAAELARYAERLATVSNSDPESGDVVALSNPTADRRAPGRDSVSRPASTAQVQSLRRREP